MIHNEINEILADRMGKCKYEQVSIWEGASDQQRWTCMLHHMTSKYYICCDNSRLPCLAIDPWPTNSIDISLEDINTNRVDMIDVITEEMRQNQLKILGEKHE